MKFFVKNDFFTLAFMAVMLLSSGMTANAQSLLGTEWESEEEIEIDEGETEKAVWFKFSKDIVQLNFRGSGLRRNMGSEWKLRENGLFNIKWWYLLG